MELDLFYFSGNSIRHFSMFSLFRYLEAQLEEVFFIAFRAKLYWRFSLVHNRYRGCQWSWNKLDIFMPGIIIHQLKSLSEIFCKGSSNNLLTALRTHVSLEPDHKNQQHKPQQKQTFKRDLWILISITFMNIASHKYSMAYVTRHTVNGEQRTEEERQEKLWIKTSL